MFKRLRHSSPYNNKYLFIYISPDLHSEISRRLTRPWTSSNGPTWSNEWGKCGLQHPEARTQSYLGSYSLHSSKVGTWSLKTDSSNWHEMVSQAFKKGFISNIISLIVKLMFSWYIYLDIEFCWYLFHSFVWCMGAEHTMGHVSLKKAKISIPQHAFQFYPFFKQHWMRTCQFGWQCPGRKRTVGQSPVGIRKLQQPSWSYFGLCEQPIRKLILRFQLRDLSLLPVPYLHISWLRRRTLCWCRTIVARTGNARLWVQGVWNKVLGCQFVGTIMAFPNIFNSWELWGSSVTNAGNSFGL